MILFNGTLAAYGTLLFASWVPHATGTLAAILVLLVWRPKRGSAPPAPLWAYGGGVAGALLVVLSAAAMNSALALSGTVAVALAGQAVTGLIIDIKGLFGMPKSVPQWRELLGLACIIAGAVVLIFLGSSA